MGFIRLKNEKIPTMINFLLKPKTWINQHKPDPSFHQYFRKALVNFDRYQKEERLPKIKARLSMETEIR